MENNNIITTCSIHDINLECDGESLDRFSMLADDDNPPWTVLPPHAKPERIYLQDDRNLSIFKLDDDIPKELPPTSEWNLMPEAGDEHTCVVNIHAETTCDDVHAIINGLREHYLDTPHRYRYYCPDKGTFHPLWYVERQLNYVSLIRNMIIFVVKIRMEEHMDICTILFDALKEFDSYK